MLGIWSDGLKMTTGVLRASSQLLEKSINLLVSIFASCARCYWQCLHNDSRGRKRAEGFAKVLITPDKEQYISVGCLSTPNLVHSFSEMQLLKMA